MNFLFLETVGYESALRLSGHHYARALARRRHRVLSLSTPVTPLHALLKRGDPAVARRLANHRRGFVPAQPGVHHYVPMALWPARRGLLDHPLMLRVAAAGYLRDVERRLKLMGFRPDVLSVQNPAFLPLVKRLRKQFPRALLWHRIEDRLEGFEDMPRAILSNERTLIEEADLVSATTRSLMEKIGRDREARGLYLPNAVDPEHFRAPRPRPAVFAGIERPIALYVGALREWFDWELLFGAARALPGVQFVVVSPDPAPEAAARSAGVKLLPGAPYEEIPAYYQHAAALVIPFKRSELIDAVSPLKMFEALAAGTPVVAAPWEELRALGAPVRLAAGAEEFARAIDAAIEEKHGAAGGAIDYSAFLAGRAWDANLDAVLARIEKLVAAEAAR